MSGLLLQGRIDTSHLPTATLDDTPAGFGETMDAAMRLTLDEEMTFSAENAFSPHLETRSKALRELGVDEDLVRIGASLSPKERALVASQRSRYGDQAEFQIEAIAGLPGGGQSGLSRQRRALRYDAEVRRLSREHPDKVRTDEDIMSAMTEILAAEREANQRTLQRGSPLAAFAGSMTASMLEPGVIATLPFGAAAGAGRGVLAGSARAFATESALATAAELPIQFQVKQFKDQIRSPYAAKDVALNVLAAGLTAGTVAGVARGASEVAPRISNALAGESEQSRAIAEVLEGLLEQDNLGEGLARYKAAKAEGRIKPSAAMDVAERQLDEIVTRDTTAPPNIERTTHSDAIDQASQQLEEGEVAEVGALVNDAELSGIKEQFPDAETAIQRELGEYVDGDVHLLSDSEPEAPAVVQEIEQLLVDQDIELPVRIESDLGDGVPTLQMRSARELIAESKQRRAGIEAVQSCFLGAAT